MSEPAKPASEADASDACDAPDAFAPSDASQTSNPWPDLAGRLEYGADGQPLHRLPVRVYFEDTDFSGVVYHASYVRWCERGRSDFLRLLGNDHAALFNREGEQEAAAFMVRRMALEFVRPARIDDVLEVETTVSALTAATLRLEQVIRRLNQSQTLFSASVLVVLVSASGRPLRLSAAIRGALQTGT
ncbi:MAG: YbgC/FadM family acyl-CoA thioesterase [Pseudomonadota bacterium]